MADRQGHEEPRTDERLIGAGHLGAEPAVLHQRQSLAHEGLVDGTDAAVDGHTRLPRQFLPWLQQVVVGPVEGNVPAAGHRIGRTHRPLRRPAKRLRRSELPSTKSEDSPMAAAAISGRRRPSAARGMAAVL